MKKKRLDVITIVSGLPRSGTSLMMQMLEAGGMDILTDDVRKADEDNPKGYYEFEKIKNLEKDRSWLSQCEGKAVKIVSLLLYHLPKNRNYKIIFMKRNMQEIIASQRRMLQRLPRDGDDENDEIIANKYQNHLQKLEVWLEKQSHIDVLYISYNDIIENPNESAEKIRRFLRNNLNVSAMVRVVKSSLYRQRK